MTFEHAFPDLTDSDRAALAARARRRLVPAGGTILNQDVAHDGVFVLAAGTVKVMRAIAVVRHVVPSGLSREEQAAYLRSNSQGGTPAHLGVTLARLGTGAIFGEISFLDGLPTSASVVAESPATLLVIPGDEIRRLGADDTEFAARFYRALAVALAGRLRALNRRIGNRKSEQ